jgi:phosphohistidine phosphatase
LARECKVADFLRPLELRIDAVWHSGKARAQQTAELLAEAVSDRDRVVQREGLGPKDQVAPTKQALEKNGRDVMIVGHLPFLDKLERRDRGKWKIAWMITPALLPS